MASKKPITIAAVGPKHTATLIVAHGLGDSGAGWVFLAEEWIMANKFDYVKFIFPNAPSIPITINGGMRTPGWYDITSLSEIKRSEDEAGIANSRKYFHDLISEEIQNGIPADRIIFGGFSQGGAMSLHGGLTYSQKLAGIFGLSCYMLLPDKFKGMIEASGDANKNTKIFMGHGDSDPVVQYKHGKMTADNLKEWGYDVDFNTYSGLTHSASPKEIVQLEQFVKSVLPPLPEAGSNQGNL